PSRANSRVIVVTSASPGGFSITSGWLVRSAAARAGRVAFLAALTVTVPDNGTPPSISSLAGITHPPRAERERGGRGRLGTRAPTTRRTPRPGTARRRRDRGGS